jgi:transcriptional regulator GlxA family with amidase domain
MQKEIKVVFAVLPKVHLIDLAGPVQVFYEANQFGANFNIQYCALHDSENVPSQQGLTFFHLPSFRTISLSRGDYLFIAGIEFSAIQKGQLSTGYDKFYDWLHQLYDSGVNICSVCSGTFVLAASRMLQNKTCTTHWKCLDFLKKNYSGIKVINDQLYVKDGNMYTSAGMTSGIDMALFIVEENFGPVITSKVAREMVVFLRRSGGQSQGSIYLDFRTHIHPAIHTVQDHIVQHPTDKNSIEELAEMVNMSDRNLTRLFRKHTGISINDFKTKCRLAHAETLLKHPGYTLDYIASQCGFADGRQLRRMWKEHYGQSPSAYKNSVE